MWRYDVANDKWKQVEDFPMNNAAWSTAFVVKGKAYLGTGVYFSTSGLVGTDDFYEYVSTLAIPETSAPATGISVYPNPATHTISVQCRGHQPVHVAIYDITGRLVRDMGITTTHSFDVAALDKGMYIIQLNDGTVKSTASFIKE